MKGEKWDKTVGSVTQQSAFPYLCCHGGDFFSCFWPSRFDILVQHFSGSGLAPLDHSYIWGGGGGSECRFEYHGRSDRVGGNQKCRVRTPTVKSQVQSSVMVTTWMGDCYMLGFVPTDSSPESNFVQSKSPLDETISWSPLCFYPCT